MEAAWFRASQWELTRRGWGNAQRWEENRSVWGICEAPACLSAAFRGEKNHGQLKHWKAKCARVHIFICLRLTGPERALTSHQISLLSILLSIPQNREAVKAICSALLLHTPPVLGNSTQKDVMLLQRGATHPLPLSDQRRTTPFRTGMEILRRVINLYKVQSTTQAMVRSLSSLLLVKKSKSKALSWMESDLSLLPLFVLFSIFCFLMSNSKGSALADPNKCFWF